MQTTLLVIGREPTKDSLEAHAAATGKALSGVYENYRQISNQHELLIAGFPAVEQRSRGTADGRDWSVVLVTFLKGEDAYTLLGMTWADSDLIQVQENVISKNSEQPDIRRAVVFFRMRPTSCFSRITSHNSTNHDPSRHFNFHRMITRHLSGHSVRVC